MSSGSQSIRLQASRGDSDEVTVMPSDVVLGPLATVPVRPTPGPARPGARAPERASTEATAAGSAQRAASSPPMPSAPPQNTSVVIGAPGDGSQRRFSKTEALAKAAADREARAAAQTGPSAFATNYYRFMMGLPPVADLPQQALEQQAFQTIGPMPGTPRPAW